jgi:uncharacterized protein with PIN domain
MTAIIVDTSAVLASLDEAYAEHEAIAAVIAGADGLLVVSPMVAAESDYMLFTRLGAAVARQFAADVAAEAYELPEWAAADHSAALDVINRTQMTAITSESRTRPTSCLPTVTAQRGCLLWTSGTSGGSGRCGERITSRCCLTTCEPVRGSRQASDGRNPGTRSARSVPVQDSPSDHPQATHNGVAVSSGAAGRRGCRVSPGQAA